MQLLTGERVENLSGIENMSSTAVRTDKGTEIEADLVFKTIGLPVNSSAYKSALGNCLLASMVQCVLSVLVKCMFIYYKGVMCVTCAVVTSNCYYAMNFLLVKGQIICIV